MAEKRMDPARQPNLRVDFSETTREGSRSTSSSSCSMRGNSGAEGGAAAGAGLGAIASLGMRAITAETRGEICGAGTAFVAFQAHDADCVAEQPDSQQAEEERHDCSNLKVKEKKQCITQSTRLDGNENWEKKREAHREQKMKNWVAIADKAHTRTDNRKKGQKVNQNNEGKSNQLTTAHDDTRDCMEHVETGMDRRDNDQSNSRGRAKSSSEEEGEELDDPTKKGR